MTLDALARRSRVLEVADDEKGIATTDTDTLARRSRVLSRVSSNEGYSPELGASQFFWVQQVS